MGTSWISRKGVGGGGGMGWGGGGVGWGVVDLVKGGGMSPLTNYARLFLIIDLLPFATSFDSIVCSRVFFT